MCRLQLLAVLIGWSSIAVSAQTTRNDLPPCPPEGPFSESGCMVETDQSPAPAFGMSDAERRLFDLDLRASALMTRGDYARAAAVYDTLAAVDPDNHDWFVLRGSAKAGSGDLLGSLSDFREAISRRPDDAMVYYFRASARRDLGDDSGAARDCYQAIAIGENGSYSYGFTQPVVFETSPVGEAHKLLSRYYFQADLPVAALGHAVESARILGDSCPECLELAGALHVLQALKARRVTGGNGDVLGDGEIIDQRGETLDTETDSHYVAEALSSDAPQVEPDIVLGCEMLSTAVELGRVGALEMVRGMCR